MSTPVALLAEGVDRNCLACQIAQLGGVALLAEGVDRNLVWYASAWKELPSPSSRRAWIEIERLHRSPPYNRRRPPRGGRG